MELGKKSNLLLMCMLAVSMQAEVVSAQEVSARSHGDKSVGATLLNRRVGDPGIKFDTDKFDSNFPQMARWTKAGVEGGIPYIEKLTIDRTIEPGDSDCINKAINEQVADGGGVILLKNGNYQIDKQVAMKSRVYLVGESRAGVKCTISMPTGDAFYFGKGVEQSGIYRLTIEGGWGKPKYDWCIDEDVNNELDGNTSVSVMFKRSINCWIDGVDIIDSGDFPLRCYATHITMRDLNVDGVHNKQGGAHGYFFVQNSDNLLTGSKITHLRHISIQGKHAQYNVVYDNDFRQEVSFHADDSGNNLIENNRITLPADMPPGKPHERPNYRAIMGPWSIQHGKSACDNWLYKNTLLEKNHDGAEQMADDRVYAGPIYTKSEGIKAHGDDYVLFNFPAYSKKPKSGTLYPAVLDSRTSFK